MDIYEAIQRRCSIRSYADRPIEDDKLKRVLNTGRLAPSASNKQNWKFVVARDKTLREKLAAAAEQPFIAQASVVVAAVSTEPDYEMHCKIPSAPVDCAIALDHMTLAAVAEGLGTCWIGHFDQDTCRGILGVPESATIIELLPMGYPDCTMKPKERKELAQVVSYDVF